MSRTKKLCFRQGSGQVLANTNFAEHRMRVALDALTRIETIARANAEYLLSIARIAHTAIENINTSRAEEEVVPEPQEHRDSEGLGG
jgi:hypothetical protein